jgi:hypothetical protein
VFANVHASNLMPPRENRLDSLFPCTLMTMYLGREYSTRRAEYSMNQSMRLGRSIQTMLVYSLARTRRQVLVSTIDDTPCSVLNLANPSTSTFTTCAIQYRIPPLQCPYHTSHICPGFLFPLHKYEVCKGETGHP